MTWRRWLPPAVVVGTCLVALPGYWRVQGAPMEEGFMLVFPEMVLDGLVPNRDFLHLYGPASLWVLAAAFAVFGVSLGVQRAVGLLQILGVGLGVYALVRPWGRWVAAAGGSMAAILLLSASGLAAMAWVGGVALGLWALWSGIEAVEAAEGSRRRARMLVVAGLLAGAALLYRPDLVLALAAPGVLLLLGLAVRERWRLVLAGAVGVSPFLVHLAVAGPYNVVHGLVLEPVFELRGGRALPLPPSFDSYDSFLQGAAELDPPTWPLPSPAGPVQLSLWLLVLLGAVATLLVVGALAFRAGDQRRLLAIGLFSAGLLPQALQRSDSAHLGWVSCVALGVLPAALVELGRMRRARAQAPPERRRVHARWWAVGAAATPIVLIAALAPYFTFRMYADTALQATGRRHIEGTISYGDRSVPYKRADAVEAANALLAEIDEHAQEGDRLIVGPGDLRYTPYSWAYLYHLLPHLEVGTRYVEMDPGVANAPGSGLAEEIAEADVVVLSSLFDDWVEPNDSRLPGDDEPNRVLARDFCMVGSWGDGLFGRGIFELYVRC
jgi:hypothetical protein